MRLSAESTAVVLDSTADLPDAQERHPNWRVVPLYIRLGEETYRDHVELDASDFYARLRAGERASTSQPTPSDFEECFRALDDYERIFCVTVSAKLSGTHESAVRAAEALGDGRVVVVDSASASAGEVVLAEAIQRRLERGTDDEEVQEVAERFRRDSGLLFTVDTLEYLVRGGRIGKAAGLRRQPPEREADPDDSRRRGRAAQASAGPSEGIRRVRSASRYRYRGQSCAGTSPSPTPTPRLTPRESWRPRVGSAPRPRSTS